MRSRKITLTCIVLVLLVASTQLQGRDLEGPTLQTFGEVQGRAYHADLYEAPASCDACHDLAEPAAFPADFVCLDCHDGDELVAATARPEDDKWQNPHNNLHYGRDVPCMECHGEHQARKPLCQGCHSFEYPNYQP